MFCCPFLPPWALPARLPSLPPQRKQTEQNKNDTNMDFIFTRENLIMSTQTSSRPSRLRPMGLIQARDQFCDFVVKYSSTNRQESSRKVIGLLDERPG